MAVGLAVGVIVTLILTFGFPEQEDFNRLQVFGFVGLFVVAICVGLGAVVAIVIDRASRRRARTVKVERVEEHEKPASAPASASVPAESDPVIEMIAEPVKPENDERA